MGSTTSRQVSQDKKQSSQGSFSRLSINSYINMYEKYLNLSLELHNNYLVLLNYNYDNYIPNIQYGIISEVLSAKSFIVISPIIDPYYKKGYKISSFILHLNHIIVPKENSENENEKQAAIKLKEFVKDIMYGNRVYIENIQLSEDGRFFCDLKFASSDLDVKEYFISNYFGISYGEHIPNDWIKHINQFNYKT